MEVKGGGKQSRFSTLKVFKFGKNATPAPPPLPPKDPGYLAARNRSLASLSPDSLPASPLSGDQYAASSSSAVSLALPLQKQRSGLFKSRSKRKPASPTSPPNDDEDENISMPWNFQHNVHVDEGFTGMPPSWNTSLQEAGFSEDEIAAIQQRRMPVPPALVKPVPRSTSLPKNQQQQIESRSTPEPAPAPSSTYSSPKLGYRAPSPKQSYRPPSPKSPPPVYNYEQPLPLNIPRGKPSAAYTGQQSHSRAGSQQSSSSSHSNSYSSHSHSHSHSEDEEDRQDSRSHSSPRLASPAPKLNAKNLTLDLAPLGDTATDSTWSEAVLSATPWSASASQTAHSLVNGRNDDSTTSSPPPSASYLSQPASATSPLFTLTGPRGERGRSPTFADALLDSMGDGDGDAQRNHLEDAEFSPTTAYYGLASPASLGDGRTPTSGSSGGSRRSGSDGGLAYDDERDDEIFGIVRSPAPPAVVSPQSAGSGSGSGGASTGVGSTFGSPGAGYATYGERLGVAGGGSNRDSDATMLGVPPSAGVVRHVSSVARRAVAEVVATKPTFPAPRTIPPAPPLPSSTTTTNNTNNTSRTIPPASPQSSHFGSSGSGSIESGSGDSSENQAYAYGYDDDDREDGRGRYGGEREPETPRTEVNEDDADLSVAVAAPPTEPGARTPLDYYLEGKSYLEENGYSLGTGHKRGESKTKAKPAVTAVGKGKEYERLVARNGAGSRTGQNGNGNGNGNGGDSRSGSRTGQNGDSRSGSRAGQNADSRSGSRTGQYEYERSGSGSRSGSRREEAYPEEEEEEDEEEMRRREWEAMQRGEDVRKKEQIQQPVRQMSQPVQALQIKQQIRTKTPPQPPPQRTPPMPPKAEPRTPDARARLMNSATDTFGGAGAEEEEEEEEEEYDYGYDFNDEDPEAEYVPGAVESPGGAGGYGSAFGSPHAGVFPQRGEEGNGYGYGEEEEEEEEEDEEGTLGPKARAVLSQLNADAEAAGGGAAPALVITTTRNPTLSPGPLTALGMAQTPITPAQRYAGWVAAAVAPLEEFIDEPSDPRDFYDDLREIAEGESGSVFAATLVPDAPLHKLRLPPLVKARDADDVSKGRDVLVAIKCVTLVPGENSKVSDVSRECGLLRGLWCEQVLGLDALYVDLVEDSLWIRMELMERSLADVVGLVEEGLRLQEPRIIARFASDMLHALDYLQRHHIAHRDLRSDNLLLNREGVLKLTDFSNAVLVTPDTPLATDPVGVMFWQAPEVRSGAYDPLKIDVWSVGATVWELAEGTPPFSDTQQPADRWPPISNPTPYPPSFQEFLHMCSEPAASRPTPGDLLEAPYVQKACGRPVIVQILARCTAIEQALQAGDAPPDSPP